MKRALVAGVLVQAVAVAGYIFARGWDEFYAVAIVFGPAAAAMALAFPPLPSERKALQPA